MDLAAEEFLGFGAVGGDDGGQRQECSYQDRDGFRFEKRAAGGGAQDRIEDHRDFLEAFEQCGDFADDRGVGQHADLYGGGFFNGVELIGNAARGKSLDGDYAFVVLGGDVRFGPASNYDLASVAQILDA